MPESNPSRPELVKSEPIQPDLVVTTEVVEAARDRHDEIVSVEQKGSSVTVRNYGH